jgi:hypothetical protein
MRVQVRRHGAAASGREEAREEMAGRPNNQIELRLLSEWLAATREPYSYQVRVRLGALPDELEPGLLTEEERRFVGQSFRRWADAIVELVDRTEVVEAKIIADPSALGQLDQYAGLFPLTPEFAHRRGLPVQMTLLYAIPDAMVLELAKRRGIVAVQYRPPWVDQYLAERTHRKRRAPLVQASV